MRIQALYIISAIILLLALSASADQIEFYSEADCREIGAKDLPKYKALAEQGDPQVQIKLGSYYELGLGGKEDYAESEKWYRKAAQQGHVYAQYKLGEYYYLGLGVPEDCVEAAKWYRKAAEQGHEISQYDLGSLYELGCDSVTQNTEEAIKWYLRAANQGLDVAQFELGQIYFFGQGVSIDYSEAFKWFRRAAEKENLIASEAQIRTGFMYYEGLGVEQNNTEAAKWFNRAAEQGNGKAAPILGAMYAGGMIGKKDNILAYMWFEIATSLLPPGQEHKEAVVGCDVISKEMNPAEISEAQKLAQEWLEKHETQKE